MTHWDYLKIPSELHPRHSEIVKRFNILHDENLSLDIDPRNVDPSSMDKFLPFYITEMDIMNKELKLPIHPHPNHRNIVKFLNGSHNTRIDPDLDPRDVPYPWRYWFIDEYLKIVELM